MIISSKEIGCSIWKPQRFSGRREGDQQSIRVGFCDGQAIDISINKRPHQFSHGRQSVEYVPETESTSFLVVKFSQIQHLVNLSVDLVPQEKRENFHD